MCFLFFFFVFSPCGVGGGLGVQTRCWCLFLFFLRVAWVGGSVSRRAAGARCSGASSVVFYIYRTILVYNLCFIKIKVVINRIIVT